MISSFEVASIFSIEDRASAALESVAGLMEIIAERAETAQSRLAEIGALSLEGAVRGVETLSEALGGLGRAADTVAEGLAGVGTTAAEGARAATEQVDGMARAYQRATQAQQEFRTAAERPLAIPERSYDGESGGPHVVPYGTRGMQPHRRSPGPIIDGEANGEMLALGYAGGAGRSPLALGYAGQGNVPAVMPFGYGRTGHAGTETPYTGGGRNPYVGPESGPQINMGPRPHDESLDIPRAPQGVEDQWRGGLYGRGGEPPVPPVSLGGTGGAGGGGRRDKEGIIHFGLAEMAADWAVGDAFKIAAEEQNAIARTEIGLQISPDSAEGRRVADELRQTYRTAAVGTQFSERQTATAGAVFARELGMTAAEGGTGVFKSAFPVALRSAEVAEQEGLGSLDSTLTANLEYAHMTRRYNAPELTKSLNVLQQVATLTNNSAAEEESILKYVVPLGRAGGMDSDRLAEITGFVQQSGFNGSTAGTGLAQVMLGVLQSGGGINAHLEHGRSNAEKELTNALHLSPAEAEHSRKESRESKHVEARRELGLVDGHGHVNVLNNQGGIDMDKLITQIATSTQTMTPEQRLTKLIDAFGDRGGRIASVLSDRESVERLHKFESNVETGAARFGAQQVQGILSQTVEQQFGQSMARLSDAANAATTPLLGLAHGLLSGVNTGLGYAVDEMQHHPVIAGGTGLAATLGAAYGTFRVGGGALRVARRVGARLLGGGAGEAGAGAAARAAAGGAEIAEEGGVAAGAGAGGGLLSGLLALAPLLELGAVKGADYLVGEVGSQADVRNSHTWLGRQIYDHSGALRYADNWLHGKGPARAGVPVADSHGTPAAAGTGPAGAAGSAAASAPQYHINVGPITLSGVGNDIKAMVEHLFQELAQKLAQSLTHASASGAGNMSSAFTNGHF